MAWPRNTARTTGQVLLAVAVLLSLIFLISIFYSFGAMTSGGGSVGGGAGLIGVEWAGTNGPGIPPDPKASHIGPFEYRRRDWPMVWWIISADWGGGAGVLAIPLWMLILGTAAPGAYLLYRTRLATGRCRQCGYDLTGLPPNSPCPECGRPSGAKAKEP